MQHSGWEAASPGALLAPYRPSRCIPGPSSSNRDDLLVVSRISQPKPGRAPLLQWLCEAPPEAGPELRGALLRPGRASPAGAAGKGGAAPPHAPGSQNSGCPLAVPASPRPAAERSRGLAPSRGESARPRAPILTRPAVPTPPPYPPPLRKAATRRL